MSWLGRRLRDYRANGGIAFVRAVNDLWTHSLSKIGDVGAGSIFPEGVKIYEEEWDLLIVLDACRYDLMMDVADEYEFIDSVDRIWSPASTSEFWLKENFNEEHSDKMKESAMVTGNTFTEYCLSESEFQILDEVWSYSFDDELETIPADSVLDRTIKIMRKYNPKYTVSHFMQPHAAFINRPDIEPAPTTQSVWKSLIYGTNDGSELWQAYRDNLRYVLDRVEILLNSVDAEKVVITADHGNAMGEWWTYGHVGYVPIESQRAVPWIETSATNDGSYQPGDIKEGNGVDDDVEEKLRTLGYVN
ncbi:MAG: hypothetical protein ABEI86_11050 [Halobacteriaceae archaeon]